MSEINAPIDSVDRPNGPMNARPFSLRCLRHSLLLGYLAAASAGAQVVARPDRFGDAMQYLLPIAAAALSGYHDDGEGLKQFGLSAVLSQGTTEILKRATHKTRPDGSGLSFPSGHTSIAFVSATYVYERYGWEWATPMFGLAAATAYSRVETHHHYTRDVVAGALVGAGSALAFTQPFGKHTVAAIAPSGGGLTVTVMTEW